MINTGVGFSSLVAAGSKQSGMGGAKPFKVGSAYGKVESVLLTDDAEAAKKMEVPQGTIGAIQFRYINNNQVDETMPTQTALHLDPNDRSFPVKNEIVEIVSGPSPAAKGGKGNDLPTLYYKRRLNVYGSPEHNSVPNNTFTSKDGVVTGEFTEQGDIATLLHQPGDRVIEGRRGTSVRIGATNTNVKDAPWSGPDGSPMYVVRNGQSKDIKKGTKLAWEDINNDGTSLYFLSDQIIGFNPANFNFDSYGVDIQEIKKSNVVVADVKPTSQPEVSPIVADAKTVPAVKKDEPPVKYETESPPKVEEQELDAIPDVEQPLFSKEFEDTGAKHIYSGDSLWYNRLLDMPISSTEASAVSTSNIVSKITTPVAMYLQHNQGESGFKRIVDAAKKGLNNVPLVKGEQNINWNMYGTRVNAPADKYRHSNVGDDFVKVYGNSFTPANFLAYWISKFNNNLSSVASSKIPGNIKSIVEKYAKIHRVPVDYALATCKTESGFNPQAGNGTYKGLFAISLEQFQKVYPGDTDIYNPDKNANVGIRLLKEGLAKAQSLINSFK